MKLRLEKLGNVERGRRRWRRLPVSDIAETARAFGHRRRWRPLQRVIVMQDVGVRCRSIVVEFTFGSWPVDVLQEFFVRTLNGVLIAQHRNVDGEQAVVSYDRMDAVDVGTGRYGECFHQFLAKEVIHGELIEMQGVNEQRVVASEFDGDFAASEFRHVHLDARGLRWRRR